jgi:hypothetical protein
MLSDCPEADIAMTSRGRGNDAGNARIAWGASRSANDVWRLALRVLFLLCRTPWRTVLTGSADFDNSHAA